MGLSACDGRADGVSAPRISFVTMGCAKNEVDSAAMARALSGAGYAVVEDVEGADVIVINTCSFIQAATEESLEAIFEAAAPGGRRRRRHRGGRLHAGALR